MSYFNVVEKKPKVKEIVPTINNCLYEKFKKMENIDQEENDSEIMDFSQEVKPMETC